MTTASIEQAFQAGISTEIRPEPDGFELYRVTTPFMFDDGDHLVIVLKREPHGWVLSDEAHTYMHLADDLGDFDDDAPCSQVITNALAVFCIEDRDGELVRPIVNGDYAEALFAFAQGLLTIAAASYVERERGVALLPEASGVAD